MVQPPDFGLLKISMPYAPQRPPGPPMQPISSSRIPFTPKVSVAPIVLPVQPVPEPQIPEIPEDSEPEPVPTEAPSVKTTEKGSTSFEINYCDKVSYELKLAARFSE